MSDLTSSKTADANMDDRPSPTSTSSLIDTPMGSATLLRDLREGKSYCWPVSSSDSTPSDDLMPAPLCLRKKQQKPKKDQSVSPLTAENLALLTQTQARVAPPHPTDTENQWNHFLHDKTPERNPVLLRSLEGVPLHVLADHGERVTETYQSRVLARAKADGIARWMVYPSVGKYEVMPQWAGHEIPAIQATLRAVLGERYESLNGFVEESLWLAMVGGDDDVAGESGSEIEGDGLDWLDDVTDLLYLASKEW